MQGAGIKFLTIRGFKSLKEINRFVLGKLNILTGASGARQSDSIHIFYMFSVIGQDVIERYSCCDGYVLKCDEFAFYKLPVL